MRPEDKTLENANPLENATVERFDASQDEPTTGNPAAGPPHWRVGHASRTADFLRSVVGQMGYTRIDQHVARPEKWMHGRRRLVDSRGFHARFRLGVDGGLRP